ncbi:hypothetical protein C1A50_2854 [Paenibacillus polymyxa]|nr:hypothetical protein C1A50_2854 [Paenibacillus polymyxa]
MIVKVRGALSDIKNTHSGRFHYPLLLYIQAAYEKIKADILK